MVRRSCTAPVHRPPGEDPVEGEQADADDRDPAEGDGRRDLARLAGRDVVGLGGELVLGVGEVLAHLPVELAADLGQLVGLAVVGAAHAERDGGEQDRRHLDLFVAQLAGEAGRSCRRRCWS